MSPAPPPKRHPYDQWSPDARALDLVGDKWTLLIVRDLVSGPRRFVELQRTLPGISTEQLRSRLNRMVADGLLTRQRYREVPPRVDYELTERARDLIPVLAALARWGYEWSWTEPRRGEAIDIGAVFRLAPGLLTLPKSLKGSLELNVQQRSKDGEDRVYLITVKRGEVTLEERADADATARIAGTERAWVDALVPEGSRDGLEISGDARLTDAVLDGLTPVVTRAEAAAA
ncbi:helix-turn-helix domain-containing protein [Conexibacter sp. JD483]|uniref:winged helix-turn-helix transcriptional regulator n=1 Tax=unclassified Conexibacter TaxID=2627773 RepID=UPI00272386A8|nr:MULTISPECIES: helix-turn-helix domain-containing protein [unclassified Conexibacter]MDO8185958.1 helix-turn-helix domain-containing protein [Conexibacter sp. CPCC 205706]MDO8199449.1 helix-turn-helix domain-containing protein [Conexibacter sp. CPCC 205762]MDR9368567.1 helix-turn-helix domain-containing protein [Conexibacter sp. JD483]